MSLHRHDGDATRGWGACKRSIGTRWLQKALFFGIRWIYAGHV